MTPEHFDVVIVGAGLSGIGAACHLRRKLPGHSFVILEGRAASGGTWDLFRYPGIRSDSDMFTLGYAFRPWTGAKAIADGASILDYIRETAAECGVEQAIRYRHRVRRADWSTTDARWTVEIEGGDTITCGFLYTCSGYYDYARGHAPTFAGAEDFGGRIVHPQFWPGDLDYAGKRVVVIGSGATAVTLVPALAKQAAHVTMLQRSPSYVVSMPGDDVWAARVRRVLPHGLALRLLRWRSVAIQMLFYNLARWRPEATRKHIAELIQTELGADYDVATHFNPTYAPWDQRMCLVPDGDLFAAIGSGTASVVTGAIARLTPGGVALASGEEIAADIVVTATGLEVQLLGGIALAVDGVPVDLARTYAYKGMMFSGVPNLALAFGYTNASWTLKADLTADYVCRLLKMMRRRGFRRVTPRVPEDGIEPLPFVDFSSTYITRAIDRMPRQGSRRPWRLYQNYLADLFTLRFGSLRDDVDFSEPEPSSPASVS
ncbi:flavin-containing monooxygenase [Sphingomonas immobilis]|uniref:NAD(P)/FAD-dependent oxidoreductase n=1 Tax=Sphingomonas immobilis TaxID=3063997 RepID=A0ABT8ZUE3_9SPHN|nr:NAD(P)/FAD-dependent oxidoreductase [Sphingomonas sp. CA1-15]MDO7841197.1 NAD(P)/FAD-dependent oxidoreductase [Sphingomonas sp. CA1-15]